MPDLKISQLTAGTALTNDDLLCFVDDPGGSPVTKKITWANVLASITGLTFANTGLKVLDTNASHYLSIVPGSDLTANRTLTLVTGDADRTITYGGNFNAAGAVTLAGAFITSGANSLTLTTTGATNVTLPTSGTLATTSNKLSDFAATTSAELAGVISDETGSGLLVFGTSPTLTTPLLSGGTLGSILFLGTSGLITQDNASFFFDDTNNRVGLLTTAPTHTMTQGSTGTGWVHYNTADQTTNYARMFVGVVSNVHTVAMQRAGSQGGQELRLESNNGGGTNGYSRLSLHQNSGVWSFQYDPGTVSYNFTGGGVMNTIGTITTTGAVVNYLALRPTINQSSTGGYTALFMNVTETATGSGTKLLADLQVGTVSKFQITNAGLVGILTTPTSSLHVSGSFATKVTNVTGNTTLDNTHQSVTCDATGGAITITLPAAAGCSGRIYNISKTDSSGNTVTIDGNASETINGATTVVISSQYTNYMIQSNGTNWIVI